MESSGNHFYYKRVKILIYSTINNITSKKVIKGLDRNFKIFGKEQN